MSVMTSFIMLCCLLLCPSAMALQTSRAVLSDATAASTRININTANAEALDEALVGIGPSKARAIVAWRQQYGPFRTLGQLEEVKGLGPAFIARNKGRIVLR